MAQDQAVAFFVHFKEFQWEEVGNQLFFWFARADVGARDESAQSLNPDECTTTVGGKHLGVNRGIFFLKLAHALPGTLIFDPSNRQRELTIFVLFTHDEELTDLTGQEHIAQALDPVDRHLL